MQSVLEPQPHYRVIHHKLKDSFSLVYLTLLSVIQGVALADLALIVGAGYQQFTLVRWLLVLVSLWMLITVWHTFTIHITLWSWIPDLRDAIVPFMIDALELVFNLTGTPGTLEEAYKQAGFHNIQTRIVSAPLHMSTAGECVRFERESFGALHQMLAGVNEAERESVWEEIASELRQFEGPDGFAGPCEMLVAVGTK